MNSHSSSSDSPRSAWLPAVPAAVVALWNVGSAPFLTKMVVDPLKAALGVDHFVVLMGLFFGVVGSAVVVAGFIHLREDRWPRIALISLGLGLVLGYVALSDRGSRSVAVVEQLHFVSYGSLAALLVVPLRRLRLLLPAGVFSMVLIVALLDEGLQWLVPVRTGEFFDVRLNLMAALCGLLVGFGLFSNGLLSGGRLRIGWRPEGAPASSRWPSRAAGLRVLAPLLAVTVLLIATFVQLVHLGYSLQDPAVGSFRSFFSEEQLIERNLAATAAWAVHPPGELTPFEKEDWFRTEAGWHVVARNRANASEDWTTAYYENLIVEKYYGAFLETAGRAGKSRRLDAQHASELERLSSLRAASGAYFESLADNGRIWLRPKAAVLWPVALVLSGILLVGGRWAQGHKGEREGPATGSLPPSRQ